MTTTLLKTEMNWPEGSASFVRTPSISTLVTPSISTPSGICLTFSAHRGCVVEIDGWRSTRNVAASSVSIAGAEPITWLKVAEPVEVVEIVAAPATRRAMAHELGIDSAFDLADMQDGADPVIWAIATRFRTALLKRCDLAHVAALSRFHFLRSFRRTLGMTPHQYVLARRLEWARSKVEAGERSVEVALRLGFAHFRHFCVMYFRQHGFAPVALASTCSLTKSSTGMEKFAVDP